MTRKDHPETPDGRYFVARRRLWRTTDPRLSDSERRAAVKDLTQARRAVREPADPATERAARERVDDAMRRLGERGPVWWDDGAPDETGKAPWTSRCADWWRSLGEEAKEEE